MTFGIQYYDRQADHIHLLHIMPKGIDTCLYLNCSPIT